MRSIRPSRRHMSKNDKTSKGKSARLKKKTATSSKQPRFPTTTPTRQITTTRPIASRHPLPPQSPHFTPNSIPSTLHPATTNPTTTPSRHLSTSVDDKSPILKSTREKGKQRPPMNPYIHKLTTIPFDQIKDKLRLIVHDARMSPPSSANDHTIARSYQYSSHTSSPQRVPSKRSGRKKSTPSIIPSATSFIHQNALTSKLHGEPVLGGKLGEYLTVGNVLVSVNQVVRTIPEHKYYSFRGTNQSLFEQALNKSGDGSKSPSPPPPPPPPSQQKQAPTVGIPKPLKTQSHWPTALNSVFHRPVPYQHPRPTWNSTPHPQRNIYSHAKDTQSHQHLSFDEIPTRSVGPTDLDQHNTDAKIHVLPPTTGGYVKHLPPTASGQFRRNILEELDRFLLIKQMILNGFHNFRVRLPYYDLRKESNRTRIKKELTLWRKINLRFRDKMYPDLGGISRWYVGFGCVFTFAAFVHFWHYKYVQADLLDKELWRNKLVERHIISPETMLTNSATAAALGPEQVFSDATIKRQVEDDIYFKGISQGDVDNALLAQEPDLHRQASTRQFDLQNQRLDIKQHFRSLELPVLPPSLPVQSSMKGVIPIVSDPSDLSSMTLLPTQITQPSHAEIMAAFASHKNPTPNPPIAPTTDLPGQSLFSHLKSGPGSSSEEAQGVMGKKDVRKSLINTITQGAASLTAETTPSLAPNQPRPLNYTPASKDLNPLEDDLGIDELDRQINAILSQQQRDLEHLKQLSQQESKRSHTSTSIHNRGAYKPTSFQSFSPPTKPVVPNNIDSEIPLILDSLPTSILGHVLENSKQIDPHTRRLIPTDQIGALTEPTPSVIETRADDTNSTHTKTIITETITPAIDQTATATVATPPADPTPTSKPTTQPIHKPVITNTTSYPPSHAIPYEQSYLMQAGDLIWKTAQSTGGALVAGTALTLIAPLSLPVQLGLLGGGYGVLNIASTYGYDALAAVGLVAHQPTGVVDATQAVTDATTTLPSIVSVVDPISSAGNPDQVTKLASATKDVSVKQLTQPHSSTPEAQEDPLAEFQRMVSQQRHLQLLEDQRQLAAATNQRQPQHQSMLQQASPFFPSSHTQHSQHPLDQQYKPAPSQSRLYQQFQTDSPSASTSSSTQISNNTAQQTRTVSAAIKLPYDDEFERRLTEIQNNKSESNPLKFTKDTTITNTNRLTQQQHQFTTMSKELDDLEARRKLLDGYYDDDDDDFM